MGERCKNCGAELFAGQQFCRSCGTPTGARFEGESPTQILGQGTQGGAESPQTVPLAGGATNSVTPSRATAFYPAHTSPQQVVPLAPRRSRGWLLAFVIIGMMGALTLAALLYAVSVRRKADHVVKIVRMGEPPAPPAPPKVVAPQPPENVSDAASVFDESGADITDDDTILDENYPLGEKASVTLRNTSGSIRVEGWDGPQAEVKIIKHGGSEAERGAVPVKFSHDENELTLNAAQPASGRVEVRYEVKLPRRVRSINIASANSDVKLSDFDGEVNVNLQRGDIELKNVGGQTVTKTIKGDTKVELNETAREGRESSSLTSVSGDVELRLPASMNADLKAETISGDIKVDDDLGLKVQKMLAGKQVAGRIGAGGKSILIKVVSGDIKIKQ